MNKIYYKNKENYDINIELFRGKIYCEILNYFILITTESLGKQIFSVKKTYQKTLTNLLSSWMFNLYLLYGLTKDNFFPDSFQDTTILKNTMINFCKYDIKIINIEEKIDEILSKFVIFINNKIAHLNNYKKSQTYKKVKNKYCLKKNKIIQKRNNNNIVFYKFNIDILYLIKDNRLNNILDNILIPDDVYDKMINNYIGPSNLQDIYIWTIIFRYQLLGSNNHQLAVLPRIVNLMETDYNLNFECFASAINTSQKKFCSIFYDIEKFFGSCGNFFNLVPEEGTFSCNPPYEKEIIYKCIYKIFKHLEDSSNKNLKLTFIITIPIWNIEDQKQFNNYEQKIDYGDFNIINEIKESSYFIGLKMISKEKFTYIDYNFKLYKNKTIQHTYIIMLSTVKENFNHIMEYDFFSE
jgi:hypothetical protein